MTPPIDGHSKALAKLAADCEDVNNQFIGARADLAPVVV